MARRPMMLNGGDHAPARAALRCALCTGRLPQDDACPRRGPATNGGPASICRKQASRLPRPQLRRGVGRILEPCCAKRRVRWRMTFSRRATQRARIPNLSRHQEATRRAGLYRWCASRFSRWVHASRAYHDLRTSSAGTRVRGVSARHVTWRPTAMCRTHMIFTRSLPESS
jgi:hypothetical protein